ncbi:hypothetical protein DFS34DRAFT_659506 [Phlyctochytrium arcticum]|nr:hypothetical protein DFS34DRAFT_659506 [Phlyctochytrium arcticum]
MVFNQAKNDPDPEKKRKDKTYKNGLSCCKNASIFFEVENTDYILHKDRIQNKLDETLEKILETEDDSQIIKQRIQQLKSLCDGLSLLLKILNTDEKQRVDNYDELRDLFSDCSNYYKGQIALILEEQKTSEEFQREKYIPWETLEDECRIRIASIDLEHCTKEEFRAILILCLYVNHPPRRSLEYKSLSLNKEHANYYDGERGVLVLKEYKTSNVYGRYHMKLSQFEKKLFETYRNRFGKDDMIFSGWASNWSRHVAKIFDDVVGKPLTSTDLRKLYVSHLVASGGLKYLAEKKRLACQMGHSVALQTLNYTFQPVEVEENTIPMEVVEENTDPVVSSPAKKPKRYWTPAEKIIFHELRDDYERIQPDETFQTF